MSLKTLRKRIDYRGGFYQDNRMVKDKTNTLKKALLYSQQAEIITLPPKEKMDDSNEEPEKRKFRCLINKSKLTNDYDEKILAIPFKDMQVHFPNKKNSYKIEKTDLHGGDVIHWDRTHSDWIIYLIDKTEDAYFRAFIRECHETPMNVNGQDYKFYLRGPIETDMAWVEKNKLEINIPNYSLVCYIKKDENTLEHLKKGKKVKIDGNTWEIQVVNQYAGDGILILYLEEYWNNQYEDEVTEIVEEIIEDYKYSIDGPAEVKPYGTYNYKAVNFDAEGQWIIDNPKKAKIMSEEGAAAQIYISTGKSGSFNLTYKTDDEEYTKVITISSL